MAGEDDAPADDDDKVEEEMGVGAAVLDDFFAFQPTPLDDHPEIDVNPCLMYQIKKYKDQQREEQRIAALAAEGLSEEEINDHLLSGDMAGGAFGMGRPNALAVLIQSGARVLPVADAASNENQLVQERKRQLRTIDTYLSRALSIDTGTGKASGVVKGKIGGTKAESAYDVAKKTEIVRHGGSTVERLNANTHVAKASRTVLRAWKEQQKARGLWEDLPDDDSEDEAADAKKQVHRHGGVGVNAADLALIAMEFEAGGDDFGQEDIEAELAA